MKNMALFFLFIFTFTFSICSMLFSLFFYLKNKLWLWKYYLLFFSIVGLKIFLNSLQLYLKFNLQSETAAQTFLYSSSLDVSYLIIFIFPFLFQSLLGINDKKNINFIAPVISIAAILMKIVPQIIKSHSGRLFFLHSEFYQFILLILGLSYCLVIILAYFRKIEISDRRELVVISAVFLIFIVFDTEVFTGLLYRGSANSIHYWLDCIYYILWCIVIIFHALKHYHKYPEIPPSMDLNGRFIKQYSLTDKECEIIRMVLEGKSNRQIGEKLFISIKTVKNHIYNIFQKTGVKSRMELSYLVRNS